MYEDGGATKGDIDRGATEDALRAAVNDEDVAAWIREQMNGLMGEPGIYNGKERFTSMGNSRSFASLHWKYNAENIVKAMNLAEDRGEGYWGASAEGMMAMATPQYGSVDEMHADETRLRTESEEDRKARFESIDQQIQDIISAVRGETKAHASSSYEENDIIGGVLMQAATGDKSASGIQKAFKREGYDISKKTAQAAADMYEEAASIPTGYFEAKPQRVVDFDEALAVVTPTDAPAELVAAMRNAGMNVVEYEAGNEEDRLSVVNSIEGAKFSISENGAKQYSLSAVEPVEPKNEDWKRGATFDEVKETHPTLYALDAEENDVRNPTQIKGTVKTYRNIYDALKQEGFDGTILDASSGLGYGTRAGREEFGYDVDDIEPFADASYQPRFTDYSKLDKTYDVIISNAVLNVLPQDQRDAMTVKIGQMLNPGGRAFINVRGRDVLNASSKVPINEDQMEYFISNTGSYQKGFTPKELKAYLEDALGDGFIVKQSGKFGGVSTIVTKDGRQYSVSEDENVPEAKLPGGVDVETSARDTMPVKAQQYLKRTELALLEKVSKALSVPAFEKREYLQDILREISDEYLSEGIAFFIPALC